VCLCLFFLLCYKKIKKARKKTKKQKNACLYLFQGSFYNEMAKHKEGFNILIGSRCGSTNLYESCISKFRWKDKIFKTSLTHHPWSSLSQVGCVRGANTFPNHNQSLTRESDRTSQLGFPSNPQLNTRWRLQIKSIPITERKNRYRQGGDAARGFSDVRHLLRVGPISVGSCP
jgi:hypothetical protein